MIVGQAESLSTARHRTSEKPHGRSFHVTPVQVVRPMEVMSNEDVPLHDLFFDEHAEVNIRTRHLPHWRQDGKIYFITWHTADGLPLAKLEELRRLKAEGPEALRASIPERRRAFFAHYQAKVETWLDNGYGSLPLNGPGPCSIVRDALHHFNGQRYALGSFAIAGNHVHVLVAPVKGIDPSQITHSWKSFTAKTINAFLGRSGTFWQAESYDRLVRDPLALERIAAYIHAHADKGAYVERHFPWSV